MIFIVKYKVSVYNVNFVLTSTNQSINTALILEFTSVCGKMEIKLSLGIKNFSCYFIHSKILLA